MKFPKLSKRVYVLAGITILAVLGFVLLLYKGASPVAVVNGSPISLRRLNLNVDSAAAYYNKTQDTYGTDKTKDIDPAGLRADVLTRLIEAELIEKGLSREVGRDSEYLLANKLTPYNDNADLQRAATALYAMNYKDFWNEVLVPQAERDILAGRLFLRGEDMNEWLARAKRDAQVMLLLNGYRWNGAYVEVAD